MSITTITQKSRRALALASLTLLAGASGLMAARFAGAQDAPAGNKAPADTTKFPAAPALTGESSMWLNGKPQTIAQNRGKVVVLTFWTNQCINCQRTLPFWNKWAKQYPASEVVFLSVHTPELESERDIAAVKKFVEKEKLSFPVLIDNNATNWRRYEVRYWPSTYLIDKSGRVRGRWEGELDWKGAGEYKRVEAGIEQLRNEPGSANAAPTVSPSH